MNRATLTLLASSWSLAAVILITNPANAAPVATQAIEPMISIPAAQVVNLHRAAPMLNLTDQQRNPIIDQLGCSCAACMKALSQMQGQLTL